MPRIMGKVSIHLENVFVLLFQYPREAINICAAQALLLSAMKYEHLIAILMGKFVRRLTRTIGRVVIDDKNVQTGNTLPNFFNELPYSSLLVVSWNEDNC